ncbi:TetR/AcrR family transcriptional regulator [Frankia sp. CNm7]|uniref:TetR/AcrR family transcriptional regulator n=1 Tax=Frankia nepalensis TaxID=1836974 RepID=A0A937RHR3_9ACTN|nr:TetR/AcrR family transcriptional regulator [Frankia nepalensis]MBL7495951.1 TetR/AcrR family transcriptional regulator [Frankia nepalensis]MBL7515132.1 TetR/AcrR family transcriptional regulator [Frankia nepalensis]MBL7518860.1 TetR/AcrR family transcriptional regulator [Frankia nepalensis]MBL7629200.1 TetR/AcrR family transcriptional regulator [Frankia nepalensis]
MASAGQAPAQRLQRTDARRNRQRLLAVAREAFDEAGPDASLVEIARRAGVGQGTLYRHFPTRTALVRAVLADRIETLCRQAAELAATHGADDALAAWLRLFLTHARVNQGLAGAFMTEGPEAVGVDCHQTILGTAADLLGRAQRTGTARPDLSPDDLIQLVVGIALATARGDDADQADRLLALALDAVGKKPADGGGPPRP